ncbi:MAG: GNAT family N-acetyltransferase [Chitinophagaceae bacterium]
MITIREVVAEDAADITVLIHHLGYSISAEQTLHHINALRESKHHTVFVAVDEKVIGWMGVSYNISMESSPLCEIHGLVVDEQYRNMGIGKLLIEKQRNGAGINRWIASGYAAILKEPKHRGSISAPALMK